MIPADFGIFVGILPRQQQLNVDVAFKPLSLPKTLQLTPNELVSVLTPVWGCSHKARV
jgi:hypothetical protein